MTGLVLDLFAGPGGWDEGVRALGMTPHGIEWDSAAVATATAAGHRRRQADVAALEPRHYGVTRGLIASPPCQGFSTAGSGKGRDDSQHLLDGLRFVQTRYDLEQLIRQLAPTMTDTRTLLVLEPLRWAMALRPGWLAWEQVPTVLPLWEACAVVLRRLGYSVATGVLNAEQYGVPQTRRRAILTARAGWLAAEQGPAVLPTPTHSRYHVRTPDRLDDGVLQWVSMADALGWAADDRAGFPRRNDGAPDPVTIDGVEYRSRDLHPAGRPSPALTEKARSWSRVMHAAGSTSPETAGTRPRDPEAAPSATITGKGTVAWEYVNGTHDHAARRPEDSPAPTVMFGDRANAVTWQAQTVLMAGTRPESTIRAETTPAPGLAFGKDAASHVWAPAGTTSSELPDLKARRAVVRVTVEEASVLQGFPAGYPWSGSKTAQYRQVGDAVPPPLARAIVAAVMDR